MKENERKCYKCGCSPAQDPNIILHRFPKPGRTNSLRCELWAKFCFRHDSWSSPEFQKKLHSRHLMLCTKHFKRSSFIDDSGKKLARSAAPDEECEKITLPDPNLDQINVIQPIADASVTVQPLCDINDHNYSKKEDFEEMAEEDPVVHQDSTTVNIFESDEIPLTSEESVNVIQIDSIEFQGIESDQNLLSDSFGSVHLQPQTSFGTDHLRPKPSFIVGRYRFRQRKQNPDESIMYYISELEKMTIFCDFKTDSEEHLRDQLVYGLQSEQIRQRLFAEESLDYAKAVEIACAMEVVETGAGVVEQTLVRDAESGDREVATRVLHGDSEDARFANNTINICYVCGSADHWGEGCEQSRFFCGICKQKGHLNQSCPMRTGGRQLQGRCDTGITGSRQLQGRCDTDVTGNRQLQGRCDTDDQEVHVRVASGVTGHLYQLGEDKPPSSDKENWETEEDLQQLSRKGCKHFVILVDEAQLPMDIDMESIVSCISKT